MMTVEGTEIEVLDVGIENHDAGPDFMNAKVKMNSIVWAGNVELHTAASDWMKHRHHTDAAYDSVILHVVERMDSDSIVKMNGDTIPHLLLAVPPHVQENYKYLTSLDRDVACLPMLALLPSILLTSWKDALLAERMERKSSAIDDLCVAYQDDWDAVFYITLCRNFGFGLNSDAFEWLAKSLPYKIVLKHCDSVTDIEALLFGQAEFLNEELQEGYPRYLRERYLFFRHKYELTPLAPSLFKNARTRPQSFPYTRMAQLARILSRSRGLFSKILEIDQLVSLIPLFDTSVSFFWKKHFTFNTSCDFSQHRIGTPSLHILMINTVIPMRFAYYRRKKNSEKEEKTLAMLESLPPESNQITRMFAKGGVSCLSAFDSQALIQLKKEYCDKKRCLQCRIGQKLLQQGR
jgi:hypothetical protein